MANILVRWKEFIEYKNACTLKYAVDILDIPTEVELKCVALPGEPDEFGRHKLTWRCTFTNKGIKKHKRYKEIRTAVLEGITDGTPSLVPKRTKD